MNLLLRSIAGAAVFGLLQGVPAFPRSERKDKKQATSPGLRLEVTAGDSRQPVPEADVLVRYVPERGATGKKVEVNVKTDAGGIAQVTGIPAGKIFLRVGAKGFKSFYRWYEYAGERQTIQIPLEKLPRWEGKPR